MSFLAWLIVSFASGLILGGLARLALPGRDPMTLWQTALVGIAGSWGAGLIVILITGGHHTAGLFASFVGSVAIVYAVRRSRGGSLTDPGRPRELR
jgi:uncharacterized membrane protein YeaQ/YmgE (transglycosylase-associated protein family)